MGNEQNLHLIIQESLECQSQPPLALPGRWCNLALSAEPTAEERKAAQENGACRIFFRWGP